MLLNAYPLAGDAKVSIILKIEKGIHFFYVFWAALIRFEK